MNKKIEIVANRAVILASLTLSTLVHAHTWVSHPRITGIYVYDESHAYIKTDNNQNPDNCQDPSYLMLDMNAANFNILYSTALAAYTTGSTVSINYEGASVLTLG